LGPELPRQHRRPYTVRNPQQPAVQEFNHSPTRLSRQLAMAPGVTFWIRFTSPAGVSALCAIHSTLLFKKSTTQTYSLVSTAGHGAWSNLWDENCLALSAIVKRWIHSCFQQQLAAWLRSQRVNVASWYSAPSTTTCCARIQSLTHSLVSTQQVMVF
jgi:hypothetical protein